MKNNSPTLAIFFAILAALFYAFNAPFSRILLSDIGPTIMAGLLYLGAGIGVSIIYIFKYKDEDSSEHLTKEDLPYVIGMILLDIMAPIFLMMGLIYGTASNASVLGNFEIVATSLIALFIFKERISRLLWIAIIFVSLASFILSFDGSHGFTPSIGSLYVLLATTFWGLENNCTRMISHRSTYEIVSIKGIFSGIGSLIVAFILKEQFPEVLNVAKVMLLGFVSYGLSIFMYVRAQRILGAAKTSAFYALAPFLGAFLSFLLLKEPLSTNFLLAFFLMTVGTIFTIKDTMKSTII